jgi:hypothetical protein
MSILEGCFYVAYLAAIWFLDWLIAEVRRDTTNAAQTQTQSNNKALPASSPLP